MKKRVTQWIGGGLLSALAILIYLFLYNTSFFSAFLIGQFNTNFLKPYQLSASGKITGSLLGRSIGFQDLLLTGGQNNDTLFSASEVLIRGWEIEWDLNDIIIHNAKMRDFFIDAAKFQNVTTGDSIRSTSLSMIVERFEAESGDLHFHLSDSLHSASIDRLNSNAWFIDGHTGINITQLFVQIPAFTDDSLIISGLIGIDREGTKRINKLHLNFPHSDMQISGEIGDGWIGARLKAINVNPSSFPVLNFYGNYPDLFIDYDLDLYKNDSELSIGGIGSFAHKGSRYTFDLANYTDHVGERSLDLSVGPAQNNTHLKLKIAKNGAISGTAKVFRAKLDSFIPSEKLRFNEPIGFATFKGNKKGFEVYTELESFILNGIHFDTLKSEMTILPEQGIIFHTGLMTEKSNRIDFSGDATPEELNINAHMQISDLSFMQSQLGWKVMEGQLSGNMNLKGAPNNLQVFGELLPDNLGYGNQLRLNGLAKYKFQFSDGRPYGNIAFQGEKGTLLGDTLLAYQLLANISDNRYELEDLHFQSTHNIVSASGAGGNDGLEIYKLNVWKEENQFNLIDTLEIKKVKKGEYLLNPGVMVFNSAGISLEGSYTEVTGFNVSAEYELLDLKDITEFFDIPIPFEGIATGSAKIVGPPEHPEILTDLYLQKGLTLGYPSDSAHIDLILRPNSTTSNRIDAKRAGGSLTLIGKLPWGYKMRGDTYKRAQQNFSISFENYRLEDIKLRSVVGKPIKGRASGSISIRGTPLNTKMDAQVTLQQAKFDTINFTSVYSDFVYENNLWTFDSLSAISTWGYGSGTGSMPISLDMVAADRSTASDREIGLNFDFILNQMPFLTSYISSIDAIEGTFAANLSLTGPMSAPIRNGKVRGHNGRLEISVLGNPITNIHAEATLLDNTMTIDHFSGRMMFSEGSALKNQGVVGRATSFIGALIGVDPATNYAGTVNATGQIDFKSFFKPKFDIQLKAKEVYYRSADGLIEAIADADLSFKGQDTLDVNAVIPVKRAVYYSNFTSQESYQQTISQVDSSIFKYSLDTQYPSDLVISNDQMEAEFEGELWLLDYGDGIMRFTGTLTALEGGKFYYLGNELNIVTGQIRFQSVDFNPQITMETDILMYDQTVTVTLTGDLAEPELVINAENTDLTQSDVITYLTLNQKLVEVSFGTQSALNPVKSYSEMLVEKQLSKIGRELTGLDILDVGINLDSVATAPRFQLGQRLSKNLKVTYEGALQPIDGKSDYDFGLEYQINRNLSITSKINQNNEVELNGRLKFTY
ncbi:MAG: translocation/assembly module TamB [Candidatus Marinimicrobia bacterium]|nr:translocation/assembly module TamB [Candidatus Neomarinimicrobiota bacterium]